MAQPFVSYYSEHRISPVSQNVDDRAKHYRRREALYRHLGIVPALLQGKKILEFGPGSGHNALYTMSLKPETYVLVDANPTGLENAKTLLGDNKPDGVDLEFHLSFMEEYRDTRMYDFVLCEGMLDCRDNACELTRKAAGFVTGDSTQGGGGMIVSCIDEVSYLSDAIRRLIGQAVINDGSPLVEQADAAAEVLAPHFANLPGMSRPVGDWVLDNVTQPQLSPQLNSIPKAIENMGEDFYIFGSSPHFITDWRWYKDIHDRTETNEFAVLCWEKSLHRFLDFRFIPEERDRELNRELYELAVQVRLDAYRYGERKNDEILERVADGLDKIGKNIAGTYQSAELTAGALADAAKGLRALPKRKNKTRFGKFEEMFGRGQQYLSFIRKTI